MRYKGGRISELEAGLNITFAVPRHIDYLIVYTESVNHFFGDYACKFDESNDDSCSRLHGC